MRRLPFYRVMSSLPDNRIAICRRVISGMHALYRSFLDLLYPPLCIHCRSPLHPESNILCTPCLELLELISIGERCRYCFSPLPCSACRFSERPFVGLAAALAYMGPAQSMIRLLKYGGQSCLSRAMAPYLALQFLRLRWPIPDAVIPMPVSFMHRLERGYNQSALLAEELALLLDVPCVYPLKRKSGDYSQTGLAYRERIRLSRSSFSVRRKELVFGKSLLLVDDVMTTSTTMRCAAESLSEELPRALYGITFASAQ